MKDKVIYITCDDNNFKYAVDFFNSLIKFHSPKYIDMRLYTTMKKEEELNKIDPRIRIIDLSPYLKDDNMFFYRQKPVVNEELLKEYELVIGMDCDQIVCGDLSYIWETKDYDVATVLNYNRVDPKIYGFVGGWGILPVEYFNCGLVAIRSDKFNHLWKVDCFTEQFNRLQFKEQDILNVLCYYGNFNVRCLDHGDGPAKMHAWWGLVSKSEVNRAIVKDGRILIPKGNDGYPPIETELKVFHIAGGNVKQSYRTLFSEEAIKRINYLISPTEV